MWAYAVPLIRHSKICAHWHVLIDSAVHTLLGAGRTRRFSSNSMFSISQEKVIPRQNWFPRSDRLVYWLCVKRLMYRYCGTNKIFLKNFTEYSNVVDIVSVTNFKIGTYIVPEKYLTPSWKQFWNHQNLNTATSKSIVSVSGKYGCRFDMLQL